MPDKKFNWSAKKCLILWIVTFVLLGVLLNIHVIKTVSETVSEPTYHMINEAKNAFHYKIVITVCVAFWFLPLAITTYKKAKSTSKRIKNIALILTIYMYLGLFAFPIALLIHLLQ